MNNHKEYFYRIFKGRKKYYIRTANGHKKIAKSKISSYFIDEIELCSVNDRNWLKTKSIYVKKLDKAVDRLKIIDNSSLKNYSKTKRDLEENIKFYRKKIQYYECQNIDESKKRYQKKPRKDNK